MTKVDQKEERLWGMLCHLSALLSCIGIVFGLKFGLPLGHIIGPLVVWLIKKNEYAYVDKQGKEALNFQLSMTIYGIVAWLLCFIYIGIPIVFVLIIAWFILVIIASVKASNGEDYQYPLTIRFLQQ